MTTWWNKNAETRMNDFKSWVGDFNQASKVYCRKYVVNKQYKTIIDCGCGLATDYYGFKNDEYEINYTGLDSCNFFINSNRENGISMIEAELEETLPIPDSSYEVVYCREVLEHLSYYEKTLNELIRIASKEVIIVFFIKPDGEENINYWGEEDLYHNKYNKEKMEAFIMNNPRVDKLFWVDIFDLPYAVEASSTETPSTETAKPTGEKVVLHIILK